MTEEQDAEVLAAADTHDALAARDASSGTAASDDAQVASDVFARRRAEMGLSLEDVANQLKFSARQIEALEAGDFERLPGGTFVRGMIRSYARLLKLEPDQIVDQLSAAGAKPQVALEKAVSLRAPIPFSEGGKHVNLMYMFLSLVILLAVAFFAIQWYQESRSNGKLAFVRPVSVVSPSVGMPTQGVAPSPSGATVGAGVVPEATTLASAGAAPPAETTSPADDKGASPIASAMAAAKADAPVATGPAATSTGPGKRRITLHFDAESWVQIKAARGEVLLSQLNPGGTEKVVEGAPPFELTIGNASRVRLLYNGRPVDLKPYVNVDVARLTLD